MPRKLRFTRLPTHLHGLMVRAQVEWRRYLDVNPDQYYWVCIERPEIMARALEILAADLPEEDLALLVMRMPYLILLFQELEEARHVPIESTVAFLTILNHAGLATLMRQTSDTHRLADLVGLDHSRLRPILFMVAGVPDLDHPLGQEPDSGCLFL